MSYGCRKIPVPVLVLVFLLLFGGCGRDEIVELAPVNGEAETSEPAPVNGEAEAAGGAQAAGNLRTDAEPSDTAQTAAPAAQADSAAASGSIAAGGQSGAEESETEPAVWMVHICGAVNRPGVYTFPEGSRVCDAVEAAGGLSEDAAESLLNQAALLSDGLQIVVPTLEEAEGLSRQTASSGIFSSGISGAGSAAGHAASDQTGECGFCQSARLASSEGKGGTGIPGPLSGSPPEIRSGGNQRGETADRLRAGDSYPRSERA